MNNKLFLVLLAPVLMIHIAYATVVKDPRTQPITQQQFLQISAKTPIESRLHGRLITRAMASGLIGIAYIQYTKLWRKQPKNAYAMYWRGNTALSYWYSATYPSSTARLSPEQKSILWQTGRDGLRDAVKIKPDLSWANASYGNFLFNQTGSEQEGMKLMRKAVDLEPRNASLWFALGDALSNPYRDSHDPKEAEKSLLMAIRLDAHYAAPHYTLIRFYIGQKRFKEAQRQLASFTRLVPAKDAKSTTKFFQPQIDKGLQNP